MSPMQQQQQQPPQQLPPPGQFPPGQFPPPRFGPPPGMAGPPQGMPGPGMPPQTRPMGPPNELWIETKTDEGKSYYYHAVTRQTTWTRPAGPNVQVIYN